MLNRFIYYPNQSPANIQFSQYIFNTLSVNPAYAGYKEEWFAQMALRNQWAGLDGAPKTGQLSIDGIFDYIVRIRHVYFIAGSLHTLTSGFKIKPSIMIREDFKGPTNADLNAMAILNDRLWPGAGYRTSLKVLKRNTSKQT